MTEDERDLLQERAENFGRNVEMGLRDEEIIGNQPAGFAKKKKRYTITMKGIGILMSACIVFSGLFGFGGAMLANSLSSGVPLGSGVLPSGQGLSSTGYNLERATDSELTIQEIIALNEKAVVEIRTESVVTDSWMMQYVTEGAGSGVIISSEGYIITNNHVIDDASKIMVTLKDGKEYEAKVVGNDDETDVAVIKIEASGLTSAVYGDSDLLAVGDLAVAIGNPLGKLGGTATAGIISALDRELTIDGQSMTLLQTDASINPGNSGGGLFNQYGELVGVVVAKSTGSDVEGLGFAIPINKAKDVAQQLVDYGYVKGRSDVGMTFMDLTSTRDALMYGVRNTGIYVKSVDGENAKKAGFMAGDMIYYVEDTRITDASTLTKVFEPYKIGDTVDIVVVRKNSTVELTLTIAEKTK